MASWLDICVADVESEDAIDTFLRAVGAEDRLPVGSGEMLAASNFVELLQELQLCVFQFLDVADAANLCLALPPLGISAIRSRAELQGPVFAMAMQLSRGLIIEEALLRKYANHPQADAAHFEWLKKANFAVTSKRCLEDIVRKYAEDPQAQARDLKWFDKAKRTVSRAVYLESDTEEAPHDPNGPFIRWNLCHLRIYGDDISFETAFETLVRREGISDNWIYHYEGRWRQERLDRIVCPDGTVMHYEGERKNKERKVQRPS